MQLHSRDPTSIAQDRTLNAKLVMLLIVVVMMMTMMMMTMMMMAMIVLVMMMMMIVVMDSSYSGPDQCKEWSLTGGSFQSRLDLRFISALARQRTFHVNSERDLDGI